MNHFFDVAVIGLGAMGSAAAYQLAKRGVRVLGLDQFAPPHNLGSSHGETRMTRLAVGEGEQYVPLVRRSNQIWRELETETGEELLRVTGGYIISPTSQSSKFHGLGDFASATAAVAQKYGIAHNQYTAAELRPKMPMLNVRDTEHAYYEPTHGLVLPEKCIETQLRLAQALGATVRTNEKVLSYSIRADHVVIKTTHAEYDAEKIIVSAGAWVSEFLPAHLRQNTQIYRQVICWYEAEDLAQFHADVFPWVIWTIENMRGCFAAFSYLGHGTPGLKVLTEEYDATTTPETVNRTVTSAEMDAMYERFVQPRIRGVKRNCLKAHACLYTLTPDESFIVDHHPDSERVLIASPCSGHGFKHSAAIGETLSQLALDGASTIDMRPFSFARFA